MIIKIYKKLGILGKGLWGVENIMLLYKVLSVVTDNSQTPTGSKNNWERQ